jgi:hypothetical protein
MLKYKDAMLLFSDAKDKKKGRLLETNTRLIKAMNGDFVIFFNKTMIVKILQDDTYVLYNMGKHQPAILRKINKYTPAYLKIKKNKWILKDNFKFFNGVAITETGELKIPEPYKRYNSNECRKCGVLKTLCRCPLSKSEYKRLQLRAEQHKDDYGYVPGTITSMLSRGVEDDE